VWAAIAPLAAPYVLALVFVIDEEVFTGTMIVLMHSPAN
jgi:hypothetical protein